MFFVLAFRILAECNDNIKTYRQLYSLTSFVRGIQIAEYILELY